jgi:hypothetical protein
MKSVAGFWGHFASLHYGQIVCVAPEYPSHHSRHASDFPAQKSEAVTPEVLDNRKLLEKFKLAA